MANLRESDLYAPIKSLLETQGYTVKAEITDCDVVGMRGTDEVVVVELKTAFTLPLLFQGVRRQALTDAVYLAFGLPLRGTKTSLWNRHRRDIVALCRRLGLGLIAVRFGKSGVTGTEIHLDPTPYQPRKNKRRQRALLGEFQRRVGDPNEGGTTRRPRVTAYRQDALRCARFLQQNGPTKAAIVRADAAVDRAPRMLQRDVYGWFERVDRGIYALTPNGVRALDVYADVVDTLTANGPEVEAAPTADH